MSQNNIVNPFASTNIPLPHVDFHATVPLAHWRSPTAEFPPMGTAERGARLDLFWRLFEGDLHDIAEAEVQLVLPNWFRRTAQFLADLMLSTPPEVSPDLEVEVSMALDQALHQVLVDMTRFGTGLLFVAGDILSAVDPRTWYPDGEGGHALVVFGQPDHEHATIDLVAEGAWQRIIRRASMGSSLGPIEAEFPVVGINGPGVFPVARWPASAGGWGQSLFPDMIPLAAELGRVLSNSSRTLSEHSSPILMLRRDMTASPFLTTDTAAETSQEEQERLRRWRRASQMAILPPGFESANYVSWDAQQQAANTHFKEVLDALLATTGVPAALWGIVTGGTINSGVALRRLFAPTWALLNLLTRQLEPIVAEALLARTGQEHQVEWENPLDALDSPPNAQQTEGGEQPIPDPEEEGDEEEDDDAA